MEPIDLLNHVIAAHGGRERWRAVESIEFNLSSAGLAFTLHMQPRALLNLRVALWPHERRVELHGFGAPGQVGVWTSDRVWIEQASDATLAQRHAPRAAFSGLLKQVRWDQLDILYFAGYALWNYLSFPFLLDQPGITLLASSRRDKAGGGRLEAAFDAAVPTHSRRQSFLISPEGLLTRHDYTADVIGGWATAANTCLSSTVVEGLRFYTRRQATPRLGSQLVLPGPTLVWICLDDLAVRFRSVGGAQD